MKRLIVLAAVAVALSGCAVRPHMQTITLTPEDMASMRNDTVVMCAYAGDLPPHAGLIESDPNGYCKTEVASRLKSGAMTQQEYQLDLESAKGQVQIALAQAHERAAQQREEDAENSRENTALMIMCSRPWGC